MGSATTTARRFAEYVLGEPLDPWVLSRRTDRKSWRAIAVELRDVTNGEVDLAPETLRIWYGEKAA